MDDLVKATSVSRHGIYTSFKGKHGLFLECLRQYQHDVVSPAFSMVEAAGADLDAVAHYFDFQIDRAEESGLPGPGCLVANSATEVAPWNAEVRDRVAAHNARLKSGFENALRNSATDAMPPSLLDELSELMVVFTNGLWSSSRVTEDARRLRVTARRFLMSIREQLE